MEGEDWKISFQKLFRHLINLFAATGIVSIIYGITSEVTKQPWPVFEEFAIRASSILTLVGTALTAASVYFWTPRQTPPEQYSKITAFIAILACIVASVCLFTLGSLPVTVMNGYAIVGLSGSLLRTQPNPYLKSIPI